LRDDVGDDYHSIEDSKLASSFMLQGAKAYLMEKKSYKVDFQLSPTVCAFKDSKEKMNVAQEKGTETFYENSPFFVSESVKNDRSFAGAGLQPAPFCWSRFATCSLTFSCLKMRQG
jgi:hypothetical protein